MNCGCAICRNNKQFNMPEEIIQSTIKGDLVLFCGAGISTEGKNILPFSFYSSIQEELGIEDTSLSFSSLMQLYCDKPNGRKRLLRKIRERLQYIHSFPELERQATAFHRELSEIYPIKTIITTNWDMYFEEYCGAIPITIPEDFSFWDGTDTLRYVIKIHGSINNLSSIIATKDDYKRCFDSLQRGVIGATLKTILATKTVVFIGFSFGDEDFSGIMNYLRNEMGNLYPHIYFVTLDENLATRLNYSNSTSILTSGTFFLHKLKQKLIENNVIINTSSYGKVAIMLDSINDKHEELANISIKKYPCVIYTFAYQDGVIHAFERFIQNYCTGEYNRPGYIKRLVENYEEIAIKKHKANNYWDEAYYRGYLEGLRFIEACDADDGLNAVLKEFSFWYLPNTKLFLDSYDIFVQELNRVSHSRSKYHRVAKELIGKEFINDLVVHHPPY